ncbi:MAG: hypothetical protein JWM11_7891 [Planctomycetaceae bacterium]|nr:hypothetical protein [Planctomycetaceae bacterium]
MDQSRLAVPRRRLKRNIVLAMSALCIVATLISVVVLRLPRRLEAGQVVDQIGTYRFPSGSRHLEIVKAEEGHVQVMLNWPGKRAWFLPTQVQRSMGIIDAGREWFVSVDEHERTWLFVGPWDPQWGPSRKGPSDESSCHVSMVIMEGNWFLPDGTLAGGTNVASENGEWTGVPTEFFDRIPDKESPVWGNIPKIPARPVPFTEIQARKLAARLAQFRQFAAWGF